MTKTYKHFPSLLCRALPVLFSSLFLATPIVNAQETNVSAKNAAVSIDSRYKYQHVTGFGGFSPSPTWAYWLNDSQMDKLFGKGDDQLGLTILRTYISTNKNYWSAGVNNIKRANRYGAYVFASPWSPPAGWKSNGKTTDGGTLLEEHYDDWAKQLNSYYTYMKGQGATVHAVSLQNEPDWSPSYESCTWTGEQMVKFLKKSRHLISCKVIAPEAIHFSRNIHEPILNDPDACEALDILGGHFYGWDGSSYPLAASKGKEVWMTEYLINERQQNEGKNIDWTTDGFLFARSINDAMLANMSAWVHYSLKRYYGCLGDGTYGTTDNQITKRGYVLSQYAKYVSGTTRIRHSVSDATNQLYSSAYLSQTGDSVIVMVINPSSNRYTTTLTLPFYTVGGQQVVTSETLNAHKSTLESGEETYMPVVNVEPYTVNTFIFVKTSPRSDIPDVESEAVSVFSDNFEYSGAGCVPKGWRVRFEDGTRKAGNYSLGPRTMSFSAEGKMQYALYFRTNTSAAGYVSYGEETDSRLTLQPGDYTLYYSTCGWKAAPRIDASVQKTDNTTLKTLVSTPKSFVSSNGSGVKITEASDFSIDFSMESTDNVILKWTIAKATGGLNEALVGNIRLVHHNSTGIDDVVLDRVPLSTDRHPVFNLAGQKVTSSNLAPGIYVRDGRKFVVR